MLQRMVLTTLLIPFLSGLVSRLPGDPHGHDAGLLTRKVVHYLYRLMPL